MLPVHPCPIYDSHQRDDRERRPDAAPPKLVGLVHGPTLSRHDCPSEAVGAGVLCSPRQLLDLACQHVKGMGRAELSSPRFGGYKRPGFRSHCHTGQSFFPRGLLRFPGGLLGFPRGKDPNRPLFGYGAGQSRLHTTMLPGHVFAGTEQVMLAVREAPWRSRHFAPGWQLREQPVAARQSWSQSEPAAQLMLQPNPLQAVEQTAFARHSKPQFVPLHSARHWVPLSQPWLQ